MTIPGGPTFAGGGYCHLHVRSGFSYGYGTATPEELAEAAAGAGYARLALTDRDGLYGIPRFLRACGEAGLSPVVGAEVMVGLGKQDGGGSPRHRGHVVLLAASERGYRSLSRLLTSYLLPKEGAIPGRPPQSGRVRPVAWKRSWSTPAAKGPETGTWCASRARSRSG